MNQKEVRQVLTEILYASLNENADNSCVADKLTSDIIVDVYRLAKRQDVAHILSSFVYKNNVRTSPALSARLQREEYISVYRYEQMKFAFEEICNTFDSSDIAYIPLKGAVLREHYPYASMRTSCDIDILIHECDLERAIHSLQKRGYRYEKSDYHDVSLYAPNKTHLELHFSIKENIDSLDKVLTNAWQYASLVSGSRYAFSKEFLVFHMYAHMAYHFLSGGCGIHSLMDIWVMEHKMAAPYTCAEGLLEKAQLNKFSAEMSSISNKCFTENSRDDFSELVLEYIYNGGAYGSKENNIAIYRSDSNSLVKYTFTRIFLPYNSMTTAYPILKKAPYLLPFCWILRWIKAAFGGKAKRISSEMTCANNISSDKIDQIKQLRSTLGL